MCNSVSACMCKLISVLIRTICDNWSNPAINYRADDETATQKPFCQWLLASLPRIIVSHDLATVASDNSKASARPSTNLPTNRPHPPMFANWRFQRSFNLLLPAVRLLRISQGKVAATAVEAPYRTVYARSTAGSRLGALQGLGRSVAVRTPNAYVRTQVLDVTDSNWAVSYSLT